MGAVYSVFLKIKVKDEQGAFNALKNKIERDEESGECRYHVDDWEECSGKKADNLESLIRIFLCDRNDFMFNVYESWGWTCYDNGFDCCYSWETVMIDMFNELAPYLEDGSTFFIAPDNSYEHFTIKDGKVIPN